MEHKTQKPKETENGYYSLILSKKQEVSENTWYSISITLWSQKEHQWILLEHKRTNLDSYRGSEEWRQMARTFSKIYLKPKELKKLKHTPLEGELTNM